MDRLLGEVINRGDMIMFWGSNPAESHPRHFTKYSLMPKGMFLPNGRKDRTCVIVDVRKTKSAKAADIFVQIKPRADFEGLWTLRALAKGVDLDPVVVKRDTGVELSVWQDLMARMKACKFGVIFFGMGLTMTRGKHANSEALLALTRDMNAYTRFVAKPNRGHGNVTGADNVVSWRTGYPFGVNHSRGYPRFNPGEYTTSDTLANGEADSGMTIGGDADENTFNSKVAPLAEYVNSHPNLTIDVGQVLFGETTSMTGDGPLGYYLSKVYGGKWFSGDTDMESGCGITPIKYKNKSLVHALQWAIGLEWYLMVEDPWRVVMSTDHPNGGSFLAYPQIIRLLMDRTYRQDILKACHPLVRERSQLGDLNREYTLNEIAIITRAGPARILGLKNKGHLGPGADADITIYTPHENKEIMFELPRTVIKSGRMLIEHGEIREVLTGKTMHVIPDYDQDMEQGIQDWFEKYYSIRWRNYPVDLSYLHEPEVVPMAL